LLRQVPITITAPILLSVPVLFVAAVLSTVAQLQGRAALSELATQGTAQVHARITERLDALLSMPARLNRLNTDLMRNGRLDPAAVRSWQGTLHEQTQAFDMLSGVMWGTSLGDVVWLLRYPGQEAYEFGISDGHTDGQAYEYLVDEAGRVGAAPITSYHLDTGGLPWYREATEADRPTWTRPYGRTAKDGSQTRDLAIAYVQPHRDRFGHTLGVLGAALSLHDISTFLESLEVGRTGIAFIVDQEGLVIASSNGDESTVAGLKRTRAVDAADARIAAAARAVATSPLGPDDGALHAPLLVAGSAYQLMATAFEAGRGLAWTIVTVAPEADFTAGLDAARTRNMLISAVAVLVTLVVGAALAMALVRPLLGLARHLGRIGEGDLDTTLVLDQTPELRQVSESVNAMTEGLRDRMRLRHSLTLAMDVQQNLLPDAVPDVTGLDVAGHSTYCDETGGDYYDFLDVSGLSPNSVVAAVGDVSGHGVAAAMLMATARGVLRSRSRETGSLAALLAHMNEFLVQDASRGRFMTMLLMVVDGDSHRLRWASAGHGPPIVFDPELGRCLAIDGGSVPLGIIREAEFEEHHVEHLRPGQIIIGATDGVWEARTTAGELFGMERLIALIHDLAQGTAAEISAGIESALSTFAGGERHGDDVTFVVIKVV
jgi:sigma-B regulation protein RsbU (phosphoserine phosphatase)